MHARRPSSLRFPGFDYRTTGLYFVTCCAHRRVPRFGCLRGGVLRPSLDGEAVLAVWRELPQHVAGVETDAFALMPDHVHAVIGLREGAPALSEAVRAFKTFSARRINACHGASGHPVWQRGYYDQIIRSERHLAAVRRYVATNAQRATMHP